MRAEALAVSTLLLSFVSARVCGACTDGTGRKLAGDLAEIYPGAPGLSFASWIAFGVPLSTVLLLAAWGLLRVTLLQGSDALYEPSQQTIRDVHAYATRAGILSRSRLMLRLRSTARCTARAQHGGIATSAL